MKKTVAFCVVNSDYIDPAIIALTSFFKFNSIPVVCYVEDGTNYQRLRHAVTGHPVEFRSVEFPHFDIHETLGDKYLELFVNRNSLPAFAMRIKALQELSEEADIIVNFDLDVLFFNTVQQIVDRCRTDRVYGVCERKNRDRWMKNLQLTDILPEQNYINSGFCVYGAETISPDLLEQYESFLQEYSKHIYCPEQDFVNHHFGSIIKTIPANYNLMFTDELYLQVAPVMIHFIGADKPWTDNDGNTYAHFYYRRYLVECDRQKEYLSNSFYQRIKEKVDNP